MTATDGALTQLRAWLAQRDLPPGGRLPAERELCEMLGVGRAGLRKALSVLENNGEVWRHVGKGTFIGARPVEEFSSVASIASASNPLEVMQARLLIEPMLAREAASAATGTNLDELRRCVQAQQEATTWRQYESADNRLHRTVAEASGNTVLIALFDQLNAVRRAVVWGRRRNDTERPPTSHHSFAQHEAIVAAISDRDRDAAHRAMREHLMTVSDKLLAADHGAE